MRRPPVLDGHIGAHAHPAPVAVEAANARLEGEAAAIRDRVAAQPLEQVARLVAIMLDHRAPVDPASPRDAEKLEHARAPGQAIVGEIAAPRRRQGQGNFGRIVRRRNPLGLKGMNPGWKRLTHDRTLVPAALTEGYARSLAPALRRHTDRSALHHPDVVRIDELRLAIYLARE